LNLGKNYGLDGEVCANLNLDKIIASLEDEKFVILSIDKSKIDSNAKGGHLILVHKHDPETHEFLVNDPEPILAESGRDINISLDRLVSFSNNRGLIVWKGGRSHAK
jgi:hypothetical protein